MFINKTVMFILTIINFRLSFYERMRDIVPQDFEPLLPEKPEPKFKYLVEKSSKNYIRLYYMYLNNINSLFGLIFRLTWSVFIKYIACQNTKQIKS